MEATEVLTLGDSKRGGTLIIGFSVIGLICMED